MQSRNYRLQCKAWKGFYQFEEPVQAVVECIGFWYWVADWCQANEVPLILAHAKMLKAISYAKVKHHTIFPTMESIMEFAGIYSEMAWKTTKQKILFHHHKATK